MGASTRRRRRRPFSFIDWWNRPDYLLDAEELVELSRAAAKPLSGRLDLGVIPTIGPFLLPRLMPQIRKCESASNLDPTSLWP